MAKKNKKEEDKEVKQDKKTKKVEQSIWTVSINSQTLFKKAVDGRTVLLGMTAEENKKVKKVMDKAIDELAKILENRTTRHEAPPEKEQVTGAVDNLTPNVSEEERKSTSENGESKKKESTKNGGGSDDSMFDKLKS